MKQSKPVVRFNFLKPFELRRRKKIKDLIVRMFADEHAAVHSVDYIFCSDDELLRINQEYLHHDTLTDVITFNLAETGDGVIGEIYISIDRVLENAAAYKVSVVDELLRVMLHGALHLAGYKDKTPVQRKHMTEKESFYLAMFHVS